MEKMKELISLEAAANEWRDFLEDNDAESLIPKEKGTTKDEIADYERKKSSFDRVVKAISRGFVIIDKGVVTQRLKYPIGAEAVTDKLVFDQRILAKDREEVMSGINADDPSQALLAQRRLCAKLTGVNDAILGKLDFSDVKITDSIVSVFFM
ncbi:MAG: hypothetical protein H6Q17_560 [Bacteroidetes bacterium]|nr:hypothetical protein [Bacteroidota bacterium]